MKKYLFMKAAAAIMLVALTLTGCGADTITNEAVSEESEVAVTEEITTAVPKTEEKAKEESLPYNSFSKTYTEESYGYGITDTSTDDADNVTKYSFKKEVEDAYYVGREDNSSTNFTANNPHDAVLYLSMPMYLPAKMDRDVYYVSVSDETVAKVEGDELIPLKQGRFVLSTYDSDGNKMEDINYIVTTYNDSKSVAEIKSGLSFPETLCEYIYVTGTIKDLEYWKLHCTTLMDVSFYIQARNFFYSGEGEPEINCLGGSFLEDWGWNNSVETVFEAGKGVCLQAAQLAAHFLADDFEDWGVVLIDGNQGHIFNWFYEDGRYYVMDYTSITCDVNYECNYTNYSNLVQVFNSYDDMCYWIKTSGKVDLTQNYLIYEYSLQGFDDLPANINTGKYDSNGVLNGTYEYGDVILQFQDIIMEDLNIIWIKDGVELTFESVPTNKMPSSRLPHGVFGVDEEYRYYYNY